MKNAVEQIPQKASTKLRNNNRNNAYGNRTPAVIVDSKSITYANVDMKNNKNIEQESR